MQDYVRLSRWFDEIVAEGQLPAAAVHELLDSGFVVIPGPVRGDRLESLSDAYDQAVATAPSSDVRIGATTTGAHGLMYRGISFDELYIYQPVLEACCHVIGRPFKLSSLLARSVMPGADAQSLHVDTDSGDLWHMLSFILMVDDSHRQRRDSLCVRFSSMVNGAESRYERWNCRMQT